MEMENLSSVPRFVLGTAELKSLLLAVHTKLEATELAACNLSFHSWPGNNQGCETEKKFGRPGETQTGLAADGEGKCGSSPHAPLLLPPPPIPTPGAERRSIAHSDVGPLAGLFCA